MAAPVIHFEIHASDPPRAIAFYREVFGWEVRAPPGMALRYWLIQPGGEAPAGIPGGMMGRRGPAPRDGDPVTAFVCIIQVDDLEAVHARVLEKGGSEAVAPMDVPGVGRVFYAKDTEGNLFGVLQPA